MGFFFQEADAKQSKKITRSGAVSEMDIAILHSQECAVCPRDKIGGEHPKMNPHGASDPILYFLIDQPSWWDDKKGKVLVDAEQESTELFQHYFLKEVRQKSRMGSIVRTHDPNASKPKVVEVECCRPSIIRDIERTEPVAIVGFGTEVLNWALGETSIWSWRGRRIPIKVGSRTCWFYPLVSLPYLLEMRAKNYGNISDPERVFSLDVNRIYDQIYDEEIDYPVIPTAEEIEDGIETYKEGTREEIGRIRSWLAQHDRVGEVVGVDWETSGLRPYEEKILSLAIGTDKEAISFPLNHSQSKWKPRDLATINEIVFNFLSTSKCLKVAHNLSFELEWGAYFYGKDWLRSTPWGCTQAQAYVLDERAGMHSLDTLIRIRFGFNLKAISDLDRSNLDNTDLGQVLKYNALDAKWDAALYYAQDQDIEDQKLRHVYDMQVESRRIYIKHLDLNYLKTKVYEMR
jgi:uracil-DNA glycosylase